MFSLSKSIFRVNFLNARILGVFLCPIWGMSPLFFVRMDLLPFLIFANVLRRSQNQHSHRCIDRIVRGRFMISLQCLNLKLYKDDYLYRHFKCIYGISDIVYHCSTSRVGYISKEIGSKSLLVEAFMFKMNMRAAIEALRLCKEQTAKAERNQREMFNRQLRACFHAHRNLRGG